MKTLITKADGTPMKSKLHAVRFLEKEGINTKLLIEENGQFFYEGENEGVADAFPAVQKNKTAAFTSVSWNTNVFDKNNEKTKLFIPNTDIIATINGKYPAGQLKDYSCFEINIGNENFLMSLDLVSKIFKVKEV